MLSRALLSGFANCVVNQTRQLRATSKKMDGRTTKETVRANNPKDSQTSVADQESEAVLKALDETAFSWLHIKAILISGMGSCFIHHSFFACDAGTVLEEDSSSTAASSLTHMTCSLSTSLFL